jgi:hypothetical protein
MSRRSVSVIGDAVVDVGDAREVRDVDAEVEVEVETEVGVETDVEVEVDVGDAGDTALRLLAIMD